MTNPVFNTTITIMGDKLHLQWGMTIENKQLVWEHNQLELRLYCTPVVNLTDCKPTNDLFPTSKSSSMGAQVSLFGLGAFSGGKSEERKRFFAGSRAEDKLGQAYYPVRIDVADLEIPSEGAVHPAITWTPLQEDWLDASFTLAVVIGITKNGHFEVLYRPEPYIHTAESHEVESTVLPDVVIVPSNERVTRRRTRPKLFISYAHANERDVNDNFAVPLSDTYYYDVFLDYDSIRAGRNWKEELSLGIQEASVVLFMMTPESLKSDWCIAELNHARKHNKLIIPLLLNSAVTSDDIKQVAALEHLQYIDFSDRDSEASWTKLINQLHDAGYTVPEREIDLLSNPTLKHLHQQYLRHLFNECATLDLSYMVDTRPDKPISLLDVYVPLRLGVSFNIEVEDEDYVDWWLREVDKPEEKPEDELAKERDKPKAVNGFKPDPETIPAWEQVLKDGWERLVAKHHEEQSEKPEDKREKLRDGTWYWNRIESEVAPALMQYLVITGDAGSGKSTLLRHMALAMAGHQLDDGRASLDDLNFWPHPAFTPVFIPLRALIGTTFKTTRADEVTLEKILTYIREHVLKPCGAGEYEDFLHRQMNEGDVIFMLDGLDEVPDAEARREQVQAILKTLKTFDKCRIIVTSRPYAYYVEDWQISGFGHVDLVTLEAHRLTELAQKLFHTVLDEHKAAAEITAFDQQMKRVPDELKASPLFFTLLASIWLTDTDIPEDERLPDTRGKMYRKAVESLIARWTRKDAAGESLTDIIGMDEHELRQVLELLAYRVLSQLGEDDDEVFRSGEITNVLEDLDLDDKVRVPVLRDALAQRAAIIYAKSDKRFKFSHRSLMEHLSACYLAVDAHFPDLLVENVRQSPTKWRNVLELLPDEVDTDRLWRFVRDRLPTSKNPLPDQADNADWWLLYYACRWMRDHHLLDQEPDDDIRDLIVGRVVKALTHILELGALNPVERAEMGRLLSTYGDPRPGVGLNADGLPDIAWCEVPAGTFLMGSDKTKDAEASNDELPQHEVDLPTFYIAKYPVTNAQYKAFMDAGGYDNPDYWTDAGWDVKQKEGWTQPDEWQNTRFNDPHQPVVGVSWYEAYAFSQWANAVLNERPDKAMVIRLAREPEWEKAARGTDGRIYPYGDTFDPAKANVNDTKIGRPSAVGAFPDVNLPYSVLDMSGNVYDWCLTKWRSSYEEQEDNAEDGTDIRVRRGGSFLSYTHYSRCAFRDHHFPYRRSYSYGVRLVCAPILKSFEH